MKSKTGVLAAALALSVLGILRALAVPQGAQTRAPAFAVAAVKLGNPDSEQSGMRVLPGGGVSFLNVSLKQIVKFAYGVDDQGIAGLPDWTGSSLCSIEARAPEGTPDGQVSVMLQSLLAERFGLVTHEEMRQRKAS